MASIFLEETKATKKPKGSYMRKVVCKCGSKRMVAEVSGSVKETKEGSSEGAGSWLSLTCGKCGNLLYYNGG